MRVEENESQVVVSENTEDDEGVGVVEASVEAEVESQEEAVLESEVNSEEAKPPRKPRVKLGDVMGVPLYRTFFVHFLFFVWLR